MKWFSFDYFFHLIKKFKEDIIQTHCGGKGYGWNLMMEFKKMKWNCKILNNEKKLKIEINKEEKEKKEFLNNS